MLVVEDQHDSVELTVLLLEQLGYECRAAFDGEDAVRIAATYRPHVVLLDIRLPDISGYEVARALRALPGGANMYIAAVTGCAHDLDRRRAFEAGFNQYAVKPAKRETLRAITLAGEQRAHLLDDVLLPRIVRVRSG